ncbi:hypothetical protein HG537_0G00380 [Torulaspora globosa]|uniref:RNA-binding domain-containing protein n=1 Tax=Torulaspora globosa TaxID=48254 RepID=A0A7H9HVM8_9SACH|nr:hypothetical protein HG537_0G00380 [Torulaspora sp. CBS 2947]
MSNRFDSRETCNFYYKIGACRHGDKCSKRHVKPTKSHTIVLYNLIYFPTNGLDDSQFDQLYEDVYIEACRFGPVRSLVVCENGNDHLRGNVYVDFDREADALRARDNFNTRWFDERPIYCDLTHISDFRDAICRKHDTRNCERGDECNFMHIRRPSTKLRIDLERSQSKKWHI